MATRPGSTTSASSTPTSGSDVSQYQGLNAALRAEVRERDQHCCRWCGRHEEAVGGVDIHHIRYRRGAADDVAENLILLCRICHRFVHGERQAGNTVDKGQAQDILWALVHQPGKTGIAYLRSSRRERTPLRRLAADAQVDLVRLVRR